jgi:hypothetical protein
MSLQSTWWSKRDTAFGRYPSPSPIRRPLEFRVGRLIWKSRGPKRGQLKLPGYLQLE